MRWRDISEWQPGERRDIPNRLSIEGHDLRIVIKWGVDGVWWATDGGFGAFHFRLEAVTPKEAKREAIEMVQGKLERMLSELHQMKSAT